MGAFIGATVAGLVVCLIIGAISIDDAYGYYGRRRKLDVFDWIKATFFGLIGGAIAWFGFSIILIAVFSALTPHTYKQSEIPIVALQDNLGVQGSFFLGTGTIDSTPSYAFYINEGAAKRFISVGADDVTVFDNSDRPYVTQRHSCELTVRWLSPCFSDGRKYTEIHVPAGTIRTDLVLDAK